METKADVQLSSLDRQSEMDENTSTEMASKLSALYEVDPNKAFSEEEEKISKLNLVHSLGFHSFLTRLVAVGPKALLQHYSHC